MLPPQRRNSRSGGRTHAPSRETERRPMSMVLARCKNVGYALDARDGSVESARSCPCSDIGEPELVASKRPHPDRMTLEPQKNRRREEIFIRTLFFVSSTWAGFSSFLDDLLSVVLPTPTSSLADSKTSFLKI